MDSSEEEHVADLPNFATPVPLQFDLEALLDGKSIDTEFEIPTQDIQEQRAEDRKPLILDRRTREKVRILGNADTKVMETMLGDYTEIAKLMDDVPNTGGMLKKLIIKVGTGKQVESKDLVSIHYIVAYETMDEYVESTYANRRSKRYRVDAGQLLPALDMGLMTMRVGGTSKFLGTSEYGLGKLGAPLLNNSRIPPDARVMVQVEVLEAVASNRGDKNVVQMSSAERHELEFAELFKYTEEIKAEGNRMFKDGDFEEARDMYLEVIDCMKDMKPRTNDEINQCWKLRLNTENNLAMLFFKLGKFKASFKHAEIGTKFPIIEKEKSKSFYWCAKALCGLGDFERSIDYANKAAIGRGHDADIKNLINQIQTKVAKRKDQERELCTKMINTHIKN